MAVGFVMNLFNKPCGVKVTATVDPRDTHSTTTVTLTSPNYARFSCLEKFDKNLLISTKLAILFVLYKIRDGKKDTIGNVFRCEYTFIVRVRVYKHATFRIYNRVCF